MAHPGHDEKGRFTFNNHYGGDTGCAGRPEIYTEEWLEKELNEMIKWMKKESNIYFKDFCSERGYAYRRLAEAIQTFPRLSRTITEL